MNTDTSPLAFVTADIAIPCESLWHEDWGNGPAEWIVWQLRCCEARKSVGLICDACLQSILTYPGPAECRDCKTRTYPARRTVLRTERIGSPAC